MPSRRSLADPYAAFARVYDQDSHTDIPEAFHRAVAPLLAALPPKLAVLDLGCGSGLLTERLAGDGRPVIGVDRSAAMLTLARARCSEFNGQVRWVRADLAELPATLRAGGAVACGDVVNHLGSLGVLRRVFARARQTLAPGGILIFDALNRFCFETYWRDRTYLMEGADGDLVMECDWDPKRRAGTVRMIAYVRNGGGLWHRRESSMTERHFDDPEIDAALGRAGFAQRWRKDWTPWEDQSKEASLDRSLWCAVVDGPNRELRAALTRSGFEERS